MEIQIESSDELEQLRQRLRKMNAAQLVSFGRAARSLCRDPECPDTLKRQLEEARAEWRRRHPKKRLAVSCCNSATALIYETWCELKLARRSECGESGCSTNSTGRGAPLLL